MRKSLKLLVMLVFVFGMIILPMKGVYGDAATVLNSLEIDGNGIEGHPQTITAEGTASNKVLYQFWVNDLSENRWRMVQDYAESNQMKWTPKASGEYRYGVHIKDAESTARLDAHQYNNITIEERPPAEILELKIQGNLIEGNSQTITAKGRTTNEVLYQFWINDLSENRWRMVRDYSSSNRYNWTPKETGNYRYGVHVRDVESKARLDSHSYKSIEITTLPPAKAESLELKGNGIEGYRQTLEAKASGANDVLYQFWINDLSENRWRMVRDYAKSNTYHWTPDSTGEYRYGVHVKDVDSKARLDSHIYQTQSIVPLPPAELNSLIIEGNSTQGNAQKITAEGSAVNPVLYQFWVNDLSENRWRMVRDYERSNTFAWTPEEPGDYRYGVHIKDEDSKARLDRHQYNHTRIYPTISYHNTYYERSLQESIDLQMTRRPRTDQLKYYGGDDPTGGRWYYANEEGVAFYINPDNFFKTNTAPGGQKYAKVVASSTLNVRSGPSTSYEVLTRVSKDEMYPIVRSANGWHEINTGSLKGWVSGSFVYIKGDHQEIAPTNAKITATTLHVRSGPATSYESLGTVSRGETYLVIGESQGWYQINRNGTTGWVSGDWVELVNQAPRELYQFFILSGDTGVSETQLGQELKGKGILDGRARAFIQGGKQNNINEIYLVAHALLESGNGTSRLATGLYVDPETGRYVSNPSELQKLELVKVYNMYGIGAFDSDPLRGGAERAFQLGWTTPDKAITDGARWIAESYINNSTYRQDTLYKMRWNPANPGVHQYATDIAWAAKQTRTLDQMFEIALRNHLPIRFNIPVYK